MADTNRTIGEILKAGREEKGLSLEEVSLLTRIKPRYLAAIEAENWDVLPSAVQQKGFVRSYARAMEIDPAPLLARLRSLIHEEDLEPDPDQNQSETPEPTPEQESLQEIGEVLQAQREKLGFISRFGTWMRLKLETWRSSPRLSRERVWSRTMPNSWDWTLILCYWDMRQPFRIAWRKPGSKSRP